MYSLIGMYKNVSPGTSRDFHLKGEIAPAGGSSASTLDGHRKCSSCTEETSTGSLLMLFLFVFKSLLVLLPYAE